MMGQSKWPIAKKIKSPLEKIVHWDAPQLINLIDMNQNKYPSFLTA